LSSFDKKFMVKIQVLSENPVFLNEIHFFREKLKMPTPTFLYIGASKAGSSWIFECLKEHPQAFVPPAKDLHFFHLQYEKGIEWYESFFKKGEGKKAIGELSHDYFLFEHVADKIKVLNPNVKLLVSLREPVDKMISSYHYAQRTYLKEAVSFEDFFFHHEKYQKSHYQNMHKETAQYFQNLQPFYERFPRENILVVFFDELKAEPEAFIRRIYRFLEIDEAFVPSVLNTKVNQQQKARFPLLARFAYSTASLLRTLGLANIVGAVKRNPVFEKMLYQKPKVKKETINAKTLQKVYEFYAADYPKLTDLIQQELPASWYRF